MTRKPKFPLALAGLYGVLGSITALLYCAIWTTLNAGEKKTILHILDERGGAAILIVLLAMVVLGMLFEAIYRRYVTTPGRMGEQMLVMLDANRALRLEPEGPAAMRALVSSVNQLADQRDALQRDVVAKIGEAQASTAAEKNRLAALMSELSQSVIVCNLDGRILLYNNRARLLFHTPG